MPYYPKTKIQTNLFSNGELIKASDFSPYVGPYYKVSTGQRYIGINPQSRRYPELLIDLLELTPQAQPQEILTELKTSTTPTGSVNIYIQNLPEAPTDKKVPVPYYPQPTSQDYEIGYFTRYFAKQVNDFKFVETNQKTFNNLSSHNDEYLWQLYRTVSFPWQISGDIEKVLDTNRKIVRLEEKNGFMGLSLFLREDYLKFYQGKTTGSLKDMDYKSKLGDIK